MVSNSGGGDAQCEDDARDWPEGFEGCRLTHSPLPGALPNITAAAVRSVVSR